MLPQSEMQAFADKINLSLLNDIIAFVTETSDADGVLKRAMRQGCIFLDENAGSEAFQKKYGFLYLGELLERYDERFGTSIQDFRAIALAMGYTRDLVTDSMFVGPQRSNFVRRLTRHAGGDVYLTGALYLLNGGRDNAAALESKLMGEHETTEDMLFALSLFQNPEQAFSRAKSQLLRLLGSGRTMPVIGNMKALAWLFAWLQAHSKGVKGKDMALFRALAALPSSFVKSGSKHHTVLLAQGYSPLEIAYANMMAVRSQAAEDVLPVDSSVTLKIVVALFQEAFAHKEPLPPDVYAELARIYDRYRFFPVRCYGCKNLNDALNDAPRVSNAETFLWFSERTGIFHPALQEFDVLETKWDALASGMEPRIYRELFEHSLTDEMEPSEIQSRIDRYDALTGTSYLAKYWAEDSRGRFDLLVEKGIVDLWQLFQKCLDGEGAICQPHMREHICRALYKLPTIQAYRFYENFMREHGIRKLDNLLKQSRREFFESFVKNESSYGYRGQDLFSLNIKRDFLDGNGCRQLLSWLEEYIFVYDPEKYLPLISAILRDEEAAGLFSKDEQLALFRVITQWPNLAWNTRADLKRRYLTAEEMQAEKDAEEAAKQETERQRQLNQVQEIRKAYEEKADDTFSFAQKFLNEYTYRNEKLQISCQIVHEDLNALMLRKNYALDRRETASFLIVCAKLVKQGCMTFQEAQNFIIQAKVKESDECGLGGD